MLETINISFGSLHLTTLLPMLIAIVGGLVILAIDLLNEKFDISLYITLSIVFLVMDFGAITALQVNTTGVFDLLYIDGVAIISQLVILVG